MGAEAFDEGGLADPGHAGDADPDRRGSGGGVGEPGQQLPSGIAVVSTPRLHERDRSGDRCALTGTDAVEEGVDVRHCHGGRVSTQAVRSLASRSRAESAITVPGGKTAAAPICLSVSTSSGGMTPPITIMM